jgi:hypothetical protein
MPGGDPDSANHPSSPDDTTTRDAASSTTISHPHADDDTTSDDLLVLFPSQLAQAYLRTLTLEEQAVEVGYEKIYRQSIAAIVPHSFSGTPLITQVLLDVYIPPNVGNSGHQARTELRQILSSPDEYPAEIRRHANTLLGVTSNEADRWLARQRRAHAQRSPTNPSPSGSR